MPTPPRYSKSENTYVLDPESSAEMARLNAQDRLMTECMGGLFPEHTDLTQVRRVLDIACGPGSWACELAYKYPDIEVVGIDISQKMTQYAQAQARVQGIDNVRYTIMDATKPLDFPDNHFDIVNARFLVGLMLKDTWATTIKEFVRVTIPGGIVRLTESDYFGISNSYALERIGRLTARALYLSGRSFVPYGDGNPVGITLMLEKFLRDAGCGNIQQKAHVLNYSAGTRANAATYENFKVAVSLLQPFLTKVGVTTSEELAKLHDRLLVEMLSEDFRGLWYFLTAWGHKPQ